MRVRVENTNIRKFFDQIRELHHLNFKQIGVVGNIHERTLRDWYRGKYNPNYEVLKFFSLKFQVELPKIEEELSTYWYSKLGAKIIGDRNKGKYPLAHLSPRRKKEVFLKMAAKRRIKGNKLFVYKQIEYPQDCFELAEFVGIVLGDGGVTRKQVIISLNKTDDHLYTHYVCDLIQSLFKVQPSINYRGNVSNITISRIALVKFLENMGVGVGNKVKKQICVPDWIKTRSEYVTACLRGLFDTDGCFYIDKHYYKDKTYLNCAMNFSNRSIPLLDFFQSSLQELDLNPLRTPKFNVCLKREDEVVKYSGIVGFSNPKHKEKLIKYYQQKYGEVPKWS